MERNSYKRKHTMGVSVVLRKNLLFFRFPQQLQIVSLILMQLTSQIVDAH